jgi:hypothetical protein
LDHLTARFIEGDVNAMKEIRNLKIGIKSDKEFLKLTGRIDDGWLPDIAEFT